MIQVVVFIAAFWARQFVAVSNCVRVIADVVHPNTLLASHLVQKHISSDAVQPTLKRARLEVMQGLEHPNKDLLSEVFGVLLVTG